MLEAVNLRKSYEGRPVLADFSQSFADGGRYCLMGPSGCGKTTLLRLLAGLEKPDGGEVRGQRGLKMSMVFQENRLLEHWTARENARLVSRAPDAEIDALLLSLGLEAESLRQPVAAFSGGMKRRAALARALLADYDALFLDEPYKGLDDDTRERVMRVVDERARGKLVVLVTHDEREAVGYRVVRMGSRAAEA